MSLLDDLRSLDVGEIVSARGEIRLAVETPGVRATVQAGAASSALGSLGSGLDALTASVPGPEALLRPQVEAFGRIGSIAVDRLPIGEYAGAVREGLQFVVSLAGSVGGQPADFGRVFGTPLAEAMRVAGDRTGQMTSLFGLRADSFAQLGRLASQDLRDASAVADVALEVLAPFSKAQLRSTRESVSAALSAAASVQLPTGRTVGLVAALDAVAVAAEAGDAGALDAALAQLRSARAHTLAILRDDLQFAAAAIARLRVPQIMQPVAALGRTVRLGQPGVVEFLDEFRAMIRAVRAELDAPDLDRVRTFLQGLAPIVEERARLTIEVPVDQAVERSKAFVRRTLRQLPVRDLRQELTRFLGDIAAAIERADLAGPALAARAAVGGVAAQLEAGALTAQVQAALQQVNATLLGALDGVIGALDTIAQRIDALAGDAEAILVRLADGLGTFKASIDGIASAIDRLGIEQVEQQLVDALVSLRETASAVLSNVPLPEPLRPQVEQLIALLEGVDFDEVFQPVRAAVAELRIPSDVAATVEAGLEEARRVVDNLIPAELIASIEAEVEAALRTIRDFNPASLLPDVSRYLEEAASFLETLDPRAAAEELRGPFQAVLDGLDRVHPSRLLAPVIEAYDSVLGELPVPDAQGTVTGLRDAFDSAGRVASRAMLEPARRAVGGAESELADPEDRTPAPDLPPPADEVRAGDAIRLLGVIPARLRELLASLDAGVAGDVVARLDALGRQLAADIRQVEPRLHDTMRRLEAAFDDLLVPVGPSQVRAQLAVQAQIGPGLTTQASLDLVAQSGPGGLRRELAAAADGLRRAGREATAGVGGGGGSIERLAVALESSPLARLGADLDGLLASLDVEPIAGELDALVERAIALTPQLVAELLPDLRAFTARLQALVNHYNPGAQAQKFLQVIDVVREELSVLDPRGLAAELAEVHGAIRAAVAAYDPRLLAEELAAITRGLAGQIRALDPQVLLGDLTFLQEAVDRVAQASPAARLASVGASLQGVGERLAAIDLDALVESVNRLGPRVLDSLESLIRAVRREIVALLEALRFATAGGSVSVSASVSVG